MMATMAPNAEPAPQNTEVIRRQTRGGRTLWYKLSVLQQPERARACGAGTRANSDRRPVDPPPVVELKIHEGGNSFETGRDITYDYNASFFLYASLEQSRKVIRGRVPGQPNPPILTGVPASGMAYLDRPNQAGYFIFPDLSVRHEGYYNLSFSLFETTKDDRDLDYSMSDDLPPGVDWRMDIKTSPFEVYSAKKFPGLKESTDLSKSVAEQGCRVRIRREIRMRKRDGAKGNGRGRREEDISARRTVTPCEDPNAAAARVRSLSNSSEHRPVHPHDSRRTSDAQGPPAPGPPGPPGPPAYGHTSGGYLAFGQNGAQYPPPQALPPQGMTAMSPIHAPSCERPEPQTYGRARPDSAGQYPHILRDGYHNSSPIVRHEAQPHTSYRLHSPASYTSSNHGRRDSHPTTPISSHGPYSSTHSTIHSAAQTPRTKGDPTLGAYRLPPSSGQSVPSRALDPPDHLRLPPIDALVADTETRPPSPKHSAGDKRSREHTFSEDDSKPLQNGARPQILSTRYEERWFGTGSFTTARGPEKTVPFGPFYD